MKKFIYINILTMGMVCFLVSCNREADLVIDQGYDFFPLSVGMSRTYQVEEIFVTGAEPDTSHYFLKEALEDSIVNGDQITYLAYRYKTEDTTSGWNLDSVWTVRRTEHQAVAVENNVPFIKLTFPVHIGSSWNGNALNSLGDNSYYYEETDAFEFNGMRFVSENLIRVVIADIPENLVEQDERSEVYARGVGLVQKDYISVSFCQPGSGCEDVGVIDEGRILSQVLISYGEED